MTREEAKEELKELRNEWGKHTYPKGVRKALSIDMAINALDTLEEFEKARIIMGGRLNGRAYAYKCGLEDGKRKALEREPKKGHWIETAEEYYKAINEKGGGVNENTPYFTDDIACSECLAKFSVIDNEAERFNYCPHCGADMREVEE